MALLERTSYFLAHPPKFPLPATCNETTRTSHFLALPLQLSDHPLFQSLYKRRNSSEVAPVLKRTDFCSRTLLCSHTFAVKLLHICGGTPLLCSYTFVAELLFFAATHLQRNSSLQLHICSGTPLQLHICSGTPLLCSHTFAAELFFAATDFFSSFQRDASSSSVNYCS